MSGTSVVAVLPTYNEAATIAQTLAELAVQPCQPDIIVVDDRSPDGTAGVVLGTSAYRSGRVRLLSGTTKDGIGRAYRQGFLQALHDEYPVIVQLDADGSHRCADLAALVAALAEHDLAIGSRYVAGGSATGLSGARRLLSQAGNGYARLMLHLGVKDLTGGYKAWRRDALLAAQPAGTCSDGYAFQIEMTLRAARGGSRICEVPIQFDARRGGHSKMTRRIAAEALLVVPRLALHRA